MATIDAIEIYGTLSSHLMMVSTAIFRSFLSQKSLLPSITKDIISFLFGCLPVGRQVSVLLNMTSNFLSQDLIAKFIAFVSQYLSIFV
ncbi:MAG: hypothetical protein WCG25_03505 [bacterium]